MTQDEFIAKYSEENGIKFNDKLFTRDEDEIIYYLKKIILACERNRVFLIKVIGFRVVEDIDEMKKAYIEYEREKFEQKNRGSKVKKVFDASKFNFVDLRESIVKLLIVRYYVSINNESEYFTVLIKIPRIIDKYYFKIYGKIYCAINQIIDASTYNNSNRNPNAKTKKKQNISFRTIFMKTQMYRGFHKMSTTKKEHMRLTYFTSNIFTKSVLTFKYIFAKFGFFEGLDFMNMRECIRITRTDPNDPDMYTFCRSNRHIYISTPKVLFNNQPAVQSMIYTVYKTLVHDEEINQYHLRKFWLVSLGTDFGNPSLEKGEGILDSFENIYEDIIRDGLHLPPEKKRDMYDIVKWMMGNYSELRQKDNHDISTKRVRWALYLACHYSASIAEGLYRIADTNSKSADSSIDAIRKAIMTQPDILLKELSRGNKLVISKNTVNSDDAFLALKFSFKGLGGIGDSNKAAVSDRFRDVHPSHLGRLDVTYSSNNDPGMSGLISPTADIYDDSFSEYEEPNSWDEKFNQLVETYRKSKSLKDRYLLECGILGKPTDPRKLALIEDTIPQIQAMIIPWRIATDEEKRLYSRDI